MQGAGESEVGSGEVLSGGEFGAVQNGEGGIIYKVRGDVRRRYGSELLYCGLTTGKGVVVSTVVG